jgi:hypothetical protein
VFVAPDMSVIEERVLPADVARRAVETISRNRMDVWIYSGRDWLVRDLQAPTSPASNGPSSYRHWGFCSGDSKRGQDRRGERRPVARCEQEAQAALGATASAVR